ncbi:hypothetical protein [Fodinicola feengrottensis]|uniref:hypothetical protein n=1 Tax=Fodinicola feengrottensis TaxID=435914 RepID=UPI0013D64DC0|nr:hypothetical protein [Fodinicola feengrottensis]
MSRLQQVLSLRRQVAQATVDAAQMLQSARTYGDKRRRIDHYSGMTLAFQSIIDMIDIEFELDKRRLRLAGPDVVQ